MKLVESINTSVGEGEGGRDSCSSSRVFFHIGGETLG